MTTQLIPIVSGRINGQPALTVDARELHAALDVGKDFSNWIKDRIQQYGFQEKQDFEVFADFGENLKGGRPAKEYRLTLDMAKELAMVERTDKGRMVRRYFIECERLARSQQANADVLRAQRDALWAWLCGLKPEVGKIARYRRAGLNRDEVARALGWGEKRVRNVERRLRAVGLLPAPAEAQLSLLEG